MPSRPDRLIPLRNLSQEAHASDSLTFRSDSVVFRIQALAPDLFRLVVHPRNQPPEPSWAIESPRNPSQPHESFPIRTTKSSLRTDLASFHLQPKSGSWKLVDRHGIEIFASAPEGIRMGSRSSVVHLQLADRESVFGLGETTGTFNKRGLIREFWNADVLGHAPGIHPALRNLYASIPFGISMRDGRVAGILRDQPARQIWDIGQTDGELWRMSADAPCVDLYLFTGPTLPLVLTRYTEWTGRMPLPPRWALGYHQSRYSYASRKELEAVAREFRKRSIPCDALYADIHHMDRYRVFTFGRDFPDPAGMLRGLAKQGFRLVAIANPGVHDAPRNGLLQRGLTRDAFVRNPQGKRDVVAKVWPGPARFPDFLNARVRAWWAEEQARFLSLGVAGIWNDMNEPAVFDRPNKTLDPEARHRTDFGPRRHRDVHNLYGMQMARASRDGFLLHPPASGISASDPNPDKANRPFVITRAGNAGVQRYSVLWTGDNTACWEHLSDSLQMLLNLGLSGVPFCGSDVGGFLDNTTPELFIRWLQFAVFTPFLRNHSNLGTVRQEPWAFGPEVESIARATIERRYQLLPYLYLLFHEASLTGAPIMRPLAWHYPNDPTAVACSDQFLVGPNLMVAPMLRQGATARSVYLPRGEWFDFESGERFSGGGHIVRLAPLERIPLLVRAGTILPLTAARPCVGPSEPGTVFLHVWPGDCHTLTWYDDDGRTLAHTAGHHQIRTLQAETLTRGGRLSISAPSGLYPGSTKCWRVVLRSAPRSYKVRVDGKPVAAEYAPELQLFAFDLPASPTAIEARWS